MEQRGLLVADDELEGTPAVLVVLGRQWPCDYETTHDNRG